jgi:hypothetical protein
LSALLEAQVQQHQATLSPRSHSTSSARPASPSAQLSEQQTAFRKPPASPEGVGEDELDQLLQWTSSL